MPYIDKVLSDDETVLELGRVHWFYALQGLLWFLAPVLVWFGFEATVYFSPTLYRAPMVVASFEARQYVFAALSFGGFFIFLLSFMHLFHTELALTNKRIIYKSHWIFVDIRELDLEEIKAAHVDNGWLGRFLDYGHIFLDSRFVGNLQVYTINHAYAFLKKLNKAREGAKSDSMNVVLHGPGYGIKHMEEEVSHDPHAETHFSPGKKKRLHDRVMDSFKLTSWRKK